VARRENVLEVAPIASAIRRVEAQLGDRGRLVVRYSGTEPLLRIMLEGTDQAQVERWAEEIAVAVRATLGWPATPDA
jgi:phosphoglucosamine mutase